MIASAARLARDVAIYVALILAAASVDITPEASNAWAATAAAAFVFYLWSIKKK